MREKIRQAGNAKTSEASSAGVIKIKPSVTKSILKAEAEVTPNLSDIARIQAIKMEEMPDKIEPIVLSDTWYEYSVFLRKFNVCPNTAKKWLGNGWLPYSQIEKMRFINKADIENMMLRFRRNTFLWFGWIIAFANEWEGLVAF